MKIRIYNLIVLLSGIVLLSSCNDYLDKMPDNRTEIDTPEKVTKILVSAYAATTPVMVHELMSDNMTDRGTAFDWGYNIVQDSYCFVNKFTTESTSSPYEIWQANYKAIASANTALEAIEALGSRYDLSAQKGEALLCRAYAHFTLANAFCQAYNPQSSATDLGIPYSYDVETTAINSYDRGTVADVYAKINRDIEDGLPLIDDNLYTQPKYHFNKAAAYAFAAQFNLFYGNYRKAVDYATVALGADPGTKLRDMATWLTYSSADERTAAWVDSKLACNLFVQALNSLAGRMYYYRPALTSGLLSETIQSSGPWGGAMYYGDALYVNKQSSYITPKQAEYFVYSDPVQKIGDPYIAQVVYTIEKTLINRAEAYAMLGLYDEAAADLSLFYQGGGRSAANAATIINFYENTSSAYKKTIAPRFTVNTGDQENMIHACLHARRILTVHEGTRTLDLKRFGITYTHIIDNAANVDIQPYDKRLALQIPELVLAAGMEANPR